MAASSNPSKQAVAAIRELVERGGGLVTPQEVVQAAKKDERLHGYFTWDDSAAANKWRIEEAKRLLRFSVEVIGSSREPVRVFVSLSSERGEGYRVVSEAVKDADLMRQMVRDALEDMENFRDKYRRVRDLSRVFSAMKTATSKLKRKGKR
jgi:hypothetical protein